MGGSGSRFNIPGLTIFTITRFEYIIGVRNQEEHLGSLRIDSGKLWQRMENTDEKRSRLVE